MQEIADWLQTLGMSEYAQRFAENGIEFAALRHLTDQDLKDIGVLLGHRRTMLAAIQEFGGPAGAQPVTAESKPRDTAERRQVTVMFSDLVDSTALSARMDPGDLREVDVIGYWEKIEQAEHVEPSAIVERGRIWRPGLRFEGFARGRLDLETSKTQTKAVFDVTMYPLFQQTLAAVPELRPAGV